MQALEQNVLKVQTQSQAVVLVLISSTRLCWVFICQQSLDRKPRQISVVKETGCRNEGSIAAAVSGDCDAASCERQREC